MTWQGEFGGEAYGRFGRYADRIGQQFGQSLLVTNDREAISADTLQFRSDSVQQGCLVGTFFRYRNVSVVDQVTLHLTVPY